MENVMMIGYGVVGQATARVMGVTKFYDPAYRDSYHLDELKEFNEPIYYICVPTPTKKNGEQDLTILEEMIDKLYQLDNHPIFIIRSTVSPGTTKRLQAFYPEANFIHFPEFLTERTAFEDTANPELFMFSCEDLVLRKEFEMKLASVYGRKPQSFADTTTTEIVKYAMNTFFGMKVVLGNIFYDICKREGADYTPVREALESHKWGSKNGWNPFFGMSRGYGGKCLPKDIKVIAEYDHTGLLNKLDKVNEEYRTKI